MKTRPLTRIHDHSAMVTVLETGHVGLTTGVTLAFRGRQVAGVDMDAILRQAQDKPSTGCWPRSIARW